MGRRFGGTSFFAALGRSARKKRDPKTPPKIPKACPENLSRKCLVLFSCLNFSGQVFGISFRRDKQHFRARFRDNIFSGQRVCFFFRASHGPNKIGTRFGPKTLAVRTLTVHRSDVRKSPRCHRSGACVFWTRFSHIVIRMSTVSAWPRVAGVRPCASCDCLRVNTMEREP